MSVSLSSRFVDKASAAFAAAVEVYNKPSFDYRCETFVILALNAWELLLKAMVLKNNGNRPKSIRVYETRKKKDGTPSKVLYPKQNRSANYLTLSLGGCVNSLDKDAKTRVPPEIKNNLIALTEIRDNASHFVNDNSVLTRQAHEIAAACLKNFVVMLKREFNRDLSERLSLCVPLCYIAGTAELTSVVVSPGEKRLMDHLQKLASMPSATNSDYCVAIRVEVNVSRSTLAAAGKVVVVADGSDPDAMKVTLSEENIKQQYPWTYATMLDRLKARYTDFKQDRNFYALKKAADKDPKLCHVRYLEPDNPAGQKKPFYSPNVLQYFDQHYTKTK